MELRQALPKIVTETVPGPKSKALIDRRAAATATAVKCVYPVAIERGEGAMVEDLDGNIFLDWVGGDKDEENQNFNRKDNEEHCS